MKPNRGQRARRSTDGRVITKLILTISLLILAGVTAKRLTNRPQTKKTSSATIRLRHAELTIANQEPYTAVAAIRVQLDAATGKTDAWYTFAPGEVRTFGYDFLIEPNFAVYGESRSPENVNWLHRKGLSHATLYFEGTDKANPNHLVSYSGVKFEESEQTLLRPPKGTISVRFVPVPVSADGRAIHHLWDPLLPGLIALPGFSGTEEQGMKIISARAVDLAAALERQRNFRKRFPKDRDIPYSLGINVHDSNGRGELGVVVTNVEKRTIFDEEPLFRVGDQILGIASPTGAFQSVYGPEDLEAFLYQHATDESKGILAPLKIDFRRGDNELTGLTTFEFNLGCPCWSSSGELTVLNSALAGAGNAWTLGNEALVEALARRAYQKVTGEQGSTLAHEKWMLIQRNMRLKQFSPRATTVGEQIAFWSSIPTAPRILVSRALASTLLKGGATAVITNIALDTAEGSVWLTLNGSPLRTPAEIRKQVLQGAPKSAAMSVAFTAGMGCFGSLRHHPSVNAVQEGGKHHG